MSLCFFVANGAFADIIESKYCVSFVGEYNGDEVYVMLEGKNVFCSYYGYIYINDKEVSYDYKYNKYKIHGEYKAVDFILKDKCF